MHSIPYRCEKCLEGGSYYGILKFEGQADPICRVHKVPLVAAPNPWYGRKALTVAVRPGLLVHLPGVA